MAEEIYQVQLDNIFEGPMDLLVHLIKKNELDIYDIPIALITEQYLLYLDWMKAMNIDFAGDFIVMASTLTQIKSRMLLPVSTPMIFVTSRNVARKPVTLFAMPNFPTT